METSTKTWKCAQETVFYMRKYGGLEEEVSEEKQEMKKDCAGVEGKMAEVEI